MVCVASRRVLALLALVRLLVRWPAPRTVGVFTHEQCDSDHHGHVVSLDLLHLAHAGELERWHQDQHEPMTQSEHNGAPASVYFGQLLVLPSVVPFHAPVATTAAAAWVAPAKLAVLFAEADDQREPGFLCATPPPGDGRSGVARLLLSSHALLI